MKKRILLSMFSISLLVGTLPMNLVASGVEESIISTEYQEDGDIYYETVLEEVSSNMKLLQESDNGKFDNVPQSTNGLLELNDKVTPSHSAIILPESLSPAKNSNENQVTETDTEKEEKIVSDSRQNETRLI